MKVAKFILSFLTFFETIQQQNFEAFIMKIENVKHTAGIFKNVIMRL